MTLNEFYGDTALPTAAILLAGTAACVVFKARSAATRQLLCGGTLLAVLLIAMVPFLPTTARPVLPPAIQPQIVVPTVTETLGAVDAGTQDFQSNILAPSQLDYSAALALAALTISTLLALRLAGSVLALARLRKLAQPASPQISRLAKSEVRVVESLSSPVALGGFKPVILLPAEAEEWPEDRLRAILIHEEAHLNNGDPNWQILAEVACIVHWFNPLAWIVRGIMRREAEKAADDAVIMAGIRPSEYAQELAAFAKRMGADRPTVAWTAFSRKGGIKNRVQAILTPHLRRKSMSKKSRIAAVLGVCLAAYVVSAFVFPQQQQLGVVANETSWAKDVAEGKTVPASSKNGFVGRLSDGREVEILQISRQVADGKILAWKPDGTIIPDSERFNHKYHKLSRLDEHVRYIVTRYPEPKGGSIDPEPGHGSGPTGTGEPSMISFSGGGILSQKDGYVTLVTYLGVPKEDGQTVSLTFGVADGPWKDLGGLPVGPEDGEISKDLAAKVKDVAMREINKPDPSDLKEFSWAKTYSGPATRLDLKYHSRETVDSINILPILKNGKPHDEKFEQGNYGSGYSEPDYFQMRYYYAYPMSAISEFRLRVRDGFHCEVLGLAIKPKGA